MRPHRPSTGTARRGTLLLIAALCVRALVPAGFMLAPVDGRAAMVLCGPHAAHAGHVHPGHNGTGDAPTAVDPSCPFAQSAAPAVAAALPVLPDPLPAAAPARSLVTQTPLSRQGPSRQQSPRAPPLFT